MIDRGVRRWINAATDAVNARFGRETVVPVAMRLKRTWSTKFERKSPEVPWTRPSLRPQFDAMFRPA
ncbi:DUF4113 domain-containing protein [Mesorhizobium sp. C386A]|uniref:DUF4113 domain-containing protein n=1 Tax=Mesorhizobium sp. C386A TaxID=2956831 RepID=UPI00333B7090